MTEHLSFSLSCPNLELEHTGSGRPLVIVTALFGAENVYFYISDIYLIFSFLLSTHKTLKLTEMSPRIQFNHSSRDD